MCEQETSGGSGLTAHRVSGSPSRSGSKFTAREKAWLLSDDGMRYLTEPEEPGEFERLWRHLLLPAALAVSAFYVVSLLCYVLGVGVISLLKAVFDR